MVSMYGNIFCYSLIKLYDSRQQNIMSIDHLMVIFLWFLMIKFWFVIRLAGPSFLLCDPWDSWIPQQSQCVYEHQSAAQTAVLTLLCLITTGHLSRIFFFLWILVFFCDYLWSIFIWLVPVFLFCDPWDS